jgi:hypothetical protein
MALDEALTIRFTTEEMAEIERVAAEEQRTRGAAVRKLVAEALAARQKKEARK